MNGVTLITCTGGRPESLARCAKYVARFENPDRLSIHWVVVDDGPFINTDALPLPDDRKLMYVRPRHRWQPGMNTLAMNLLEAIPFVMHDNILFIEDDDWYSPLYMRRQLELLRGAKIVGEQPSRYYHVPSRRWRVMHGPHASLCQTGIHASLLPLLKSVCELRPDFVDIRLWNASPLRDRAITRRLDDATHCVGMKGLPGRTGIGIGHRPDLGTGWWSDIRDQKLREWLGDGADLYIGPKTSPEHAQDRAQAAQDASAARI